MGAGTEPFSNSGKTRLIPQGIARSPALDAPWRRFPLVMLMTLVCWGGLLVAFGFFLKQMPLPPSNPEAIEARIIELPPTGLAGGGGGSPGGIKKASPQTKTLRAPAIAVSKPKTPHPKRQHKVKAVTDEPFPTHHVVKREPIIPPAPSGTEKATSSPEAEANSSSKTLPANGATSGVGSEGEGGIGKGIGSGTGNGVGPGSGSGTGGGFGTGGTGPKVVYAPVPTIPDDMRDEVMQAVAVARFRVSHDGRATVSLIQPTGYSRLNDIILETLRQWRFHPALMNGVAVDSDAEVRLLVTVQ